ncbi:MAG: VapC toxin family PIN domain ribonuclease [Leifsonia xyli]|nr:MAG: VapC toxin family PIN domain ribonuclease [Leifsonia xyli]
MRVVDASVFVEHLLASQPVLDGRDIVAPSVVDLEVFGVWRRLMLSGAITASAAREGIEIYAGLKIERRDHILLLPRIWQLRHDITTFDAAYVALAEALGAPLLTADRKLARTARRYVDVVEV